MASMESPIMSNILPQTSIAFAASTMGKLNRTEKGRLLYNSDLAICDRIKYDPDDADRVWIGIRRTSISQNKHRLLRCMMDESTFKMLEDAIVRQDQAMLAAVGLRLIDTFREGRKDCKFMLEDDSE